MDLPVADVDLPRFWAALGLPGIVDVHVHAMPDRLQTKVWAYFDTAGPLLGREWPILYRYDLATRTAMLRSFGVRAFPTLLYPHKPGMAGLLNEWAAAFAADHPGCLQTATLFDEPSAAADVRAALAGGARVFKAHVQVGGYDPRSGNLDQAWGLLAEAGVPVIVHCGNGPVATAFTGPEIWAEVMERHPTLPAVVAHLGWPDYEAFFDLAERYPNLRLDTTGVFTDFVEREWPFPAAARSRLVDLADRILFGSDFPTIPYAYAHQVAAIASLGLGESWLRAVFYLNALAVWPEIGLQ
ncbi:MAG: amidohydrolase family protein [Sporichthyaceae bacterium]